jgi:hypothetical protein
LADVIEKRGVVGNVFNPKLVHHSAYVFRLKAAAVRLSFTKVA